MTSTTSPTETQEWFLSKDRALLDLDVVHAWLRESYWSPGIRREVVERAFANSVFVGAYTKDRNQVGVARVVSDQATFGWLCDVVVRPSYQGKGIARAMVRDLMADERFRTLRRWSLGTLDAHEVYRPLGFGPVDPARAMECKQPASAWQEPGYKRPSAV